MLKKFTKSLLIILMLFILSSSYFICFADETHEHNEVSTQPTEETVTTGTASPSIEEEIHEGDLYVFDNDYVLDKLVNGDVFIFANNVKITGKVNGNLFILGNNVTFDQSIVRNSIFICADSVYYNGYCGTQYDLGNLYIMANSFESTYESYVAGDLKILSSDILLKSVIYRNAYIISNKINFGEETNTASIYGNLTYEANKEINIPKDVMIAEGSITYINSSKLALANILSTLLNFGVCIVTTLAIFIILNKFTPCFVQKIYDIKFSILKLIKTFGIGLTTIIVVLLSILLLTVTGVGILLAILLGLIFAIIYIIAMPILAIKITNILKPALKLEKTSLFYCVLISVTILLYGLTLIPYVGIFFSLIMKITSIGLIIDLFIPHKELTDEEKASLESKKQLAKEIKEKVKQEKLEAKTAKKQAKLEAKAAKKNDKKDK